MAKKRYYQSPKDRMAESRGMERKLRGPVMHMNEMDRVENNYEKRMRMEQEGGMMIREDHMAIANLPQQEIMREYPKTDYYMYDLNDTIAAIDHQIDADVRHDNDKSRKRFPEKY